MDWEVRLVWGIGFAGLAPRLQTRRHQLRWLQEQISFDLQVASCRSSRKLGYYVLRLDVLCTGQLTSVRQALFECVRLLTRTEGRTNNPSVCKRDSVRR